jgi:hypothetical protein
MSDALVRIFGGLSGIDNKTIEMIDEGIVIFCDTSGKWMVVYDHLKHKPKKGWKGFKRSDSGNTFHILTKIRGRNSVWNDDIGAREAVEEGLDFI